MHIHAARLELSLPSQTLKEKRQIIKGLLLRTQQRFNVAVAEVDFHDVPGAASIGLVTVSGSAAYAEGLLEKVGAWIEQERPDVEVVAYEAWPA